VTVLVTIQNRMGDSCDEGDGYLQTPEKKQYRSLYFFLWNYFDEIFI